jgi:hypothetical protein
LARFVCAGVGHKEHEERGTRAHMSRALQFFGAHVYMCGVRVVCEIKIIKAVVTEL